MTASSAPPRFDAPRWSDRISDAFGRLLVPRLKNSHCAYAEHLPQQSPQQSPRSDRWLDLGGGHDVVPTWVSAAAAELLPRRAFDPGVDCLGQNLRRIRQRTIAGPDRRPGDRAGGINALVSELLLDPAP